MVGSALSERRRETDSPDFLASTICGRDAGGSLAGREGVLWRASSSANDFGGIASSDHIETKPLSRGAGLFGVGEPRGSWVGAGWPCGRPSANGAIVLGLSNSSLSDDSAPSS